MKNFILKPFKEKKPVDDGLPEKKKAYGQHFLRKHSVVDNMIHAVTITPDTTVVEIGCGDGFLTKAILAQTPCKKLVCFEIDKEWADYVSARIFDPRLDLRLQNILDASFDTVESEHPLIMLANLPYQITFPILYRIQKAKHLFGDVVVMVQEEVGQKLAATHGRGLSAVTLFFQYHFTIKLLDKIEPGAFTPPPKIFSRLIQLTPKHNPTPIEDAAGFWAMLKLCFHFPRQTLRNNLRTTHYDLNRLTEELLGKRAQQLTFADFLVIWNTLRA